MIVRRIPKASWPQRRATRQVAFRTLHEGTHAFGIVNAWDAGSARVLAKLGFAALATSSGASAGILGKRDGQVTREEALAQASAIVGATDLPVSADLEKASAMRPRQWRKRFASPSRRISLATSLYRAAMSGLVEAAREVKDKGTFSYLDRSLTTPELNGFMQG